MAPQSAEPVEVFYSYAHEDGKLRDELNKHLANLKRQGIITEWYDRDISAGKEWDDEIKKHLDTASVILLLISPDFMNSNYCNEVEVRRAMERHETGEARVIPVILRPVDWEGAPFSKLQALPTDVRPITSWSDIDEAFLDVTKGIRKAIQELSGSEVSIPAIPDIPRPPRVGFVSRRDKDGHNIVERLRKELATQKNQLVALWGAGGVGKTTLAAEAIRSLSETSGQRVIWMTADGRASFGFSTMLDDITEQLGRTDLRPLAPKSKAEALRPLIAAAPTLIVLDNFETISPEEQLLGEYFLAHQASCPVLITTRERIDNAYLITLAAMSPDEAEEYLERLIKQTREPDIYAEVDRNRILRTAEYNPLIIHWIVAQIDLAQDPEEVLSDLSHGEGDAAQRVFDRSYNLPQMAEGGRAVILALSLFMPSATRPALAEVARMGKDKDKKKFKKAQQTLASLWLMKQTDGGQRLIVEGLTRELAKTHLSHDPRYKPFRQRYVARFLRYAKQHARTTPEDFNTLESEKENLLNAMDVAFDLKDWQSVMQIHGVLENFLDLRGYWDEAIKRGEQGLAAAKTANSEWHIGAFANGLGAMFSNRGDYSSARQYYELAVKIAMRLDIKQGLSATLHELGRLAQDQGETEEALRLYGESLEIDKRLSNESGIAKTMHNLATIKQDQGEIEEARHLYNESLKIKKGLGHQSGIASTLHQLGELAQDQGEIEEARHLYNESLEISRQLGDQSSIASTLHQLGGLAQDQGELIEARKLYNESLDIKKRLGNQVGIAVTLGQLGLLAEDEGDKPEAVKLMSQALSILQKLKSPNAEIARRNLERLESENSDTE